MSQVALIVIAKEPVPGRAKTRLSPPCTPTQAAALARAALLDTLDVVGRTPAERRVLVFDGDPRQFRRRGLEVIRQRGAGLGERLAAAFEDVAGPALLVGMDTPQLTPRLLLDGVRALSTPTVDAVLGRAADGGYWSIGFKRHAASAFAGVPMSCSNTWQSSAPACAGSASRSTTSRRCATSTRSRMPASSRARCPTPGLRARSRRWLHDPSAAALR